MKKEIRSIAYSPQHGYLSQDYLGGRRTSHETIYSMMFKTIDCILDDHYGPRLKRK
ncbi:MAG: hypothetical protein Q8J68_12550 [Methanolobus sp.]|nr:hypothetical protein [Methanolobus sp.]